MGLYTIGLQEQQSAAQSGISIYPQQGNQDKDRGWFDIFSRTNMNEADTYPLYTLDVDGTGAVTIATTGGRGISITTGADLNSRANVRTTGLTLSRAESYQQVSRRSTLELDFVFTISAAGADNTEFFIGVQVLTMAALTVIPTTSRHFGVFVNQSASNLLVMTSGNGSAQSTTNSTSDSTDAIRFYRLNARWTGNDSVVLTMFETASLTDLTETETGSHTVTDFYNGENVSRNAMVHFLIENETAENAGMVIHSWGYRFT